MLMRLGLGLAFLVNAFALTLWGMWSDHVLARGWMTGLAFATATVSTALIGALFLASAVSDQGE